MLRIAKILYWRWVASCCMDDLRDIAGVMDCLNPAARRWALRERKQALRDLRQAGNRLAQLEG